MQKKGIVLTAAVLALIFGTGAAMAEDVGGQNDPLVTKSYLDTTYHDEVLAGPLENLSDTMMALDYKISQTTSSASGVSVRQAAKSGVVRLVDGSGLVLLSGSGKLADGYGTLIDLTAGTTVPTGGALTAIPAGAAFRGPAAGRAHRPAARRPSRDRGRQRRPRPSLAPGGRRHRRRWRPPVRCRWR